MRGGSVGGHALCGAFLLLTVLGPVSAGEREAYTLGVFPHLPPAELETVFAPIAADLGAALGRPVLFRSASNYERFTENLAQGAYDIAFVQPFDYVGVGAANGYLPLTTRSEALKVTFVTQAEGLLENVDGLRGKRLALPPEVAAVSILARAHLLDQGMVPGRDVTISYHRSHVSCLQQVLIDAADACGTAAPALRFFEQRMQVKLKSVGEGRPIPHTLFVAHRRLPPGEHAALIEAMLAWPDTEAGRAMLERGRLKPFMRTTDADYDVVRAIIARE